MEDYCKFFRDIEDDPKAVVPRLTVREFLQAREHLGGCDDCHLRVERVMARAPSSPFGIGHLGEN